MVRRWTLGRDLRLNDLGLSALAGLLVLVRGENYLTPSVRSRGRRAGHRDRGELRDPVPGLETPRGHRSLRRGVLALCAGCGIVAVPLTVGSPLVGLLWAAIGVGLYAVSRRLDRRWLDRVTLIPVGLSVLVVWGSSCSSGTTGSGRDPSVRP